MWLRVHFKCRVESSNTDREYLAAGGTVSHGREREEYDGWRRIERNDRIAKTPRHTNDWCDEIVMRANRTLRRAGKYMVSLILDDDIGMGCLLAEVTPSPPAAAYSDSAVFQVLIIVEVLAASMARDLRSSHDPAFNALSGPSTTKHRRLGQPKFNQLATAESVRAGLRLDRLSDELASASSGLFRKLAMCRGFTNPIQPAGDETLKLRKGRKREEVKKTRSNPTKFSYSVFCNIIFRSWKLCYEEGWTGSSVRVINPASQLKDSSLVALRTRSRLVHEGSRVLVVVEYSGAALGTIRTLFSESPFFLVERAVLYQYLHFSSATSNSLKAVRER
ncbi:hypothetical protein BDN72DRAFT_859392 [Pluteus cervinus]|uniref:Uncharacterized protein n=1 Tax=Pluteus cervinus TaxID=181527 RepID=A0ACD3AN97_9AGAR|nr:hypothetical protein BDN72DRAFT_859392 [Pluteus cervinus]